MPSLQALGVGKLSGRRLTEGNHLRSLNQIPLNTVDGRVSLQVEDLLVPRLDDGLLANEDQLNFVMDEMTGLMAAHNEELEVEEVMVESVIFPVNYPDRNVSVSQDGRPWVEVGIRGAKVKGLLDSGAAGTVMSLRCAERLDIGISTTNAVQLKAANGEVMAAVGTAHVIMNHDGIEVQLPVVVVQELNHDLILGIDFWEKAGYHILGPIDSSIYPLEMEEKQRIQVEANLTAQERAELEEILDQFLVADDASLTRTNVLEHSIELLPEARPFQLRSHHFSPRLEKMISQELNRMLRLGVIEPSSSPCSSPIVPSIKKNGEVRLCLDSRHLNSITRKDRYPVPNLPALIGRMEEFRYYVSMDMKSAFWQVPLSNEKKLGQFASSRELTAFVVPGRGLFHFTAMPFGLCNSPATQCRLMSLVLGHDLEPFVVVYLDDILIMGNTIAEVLERLREVARRLTKAQLSIHLAKCRFFCRRLKFLGFIIGFGEIKSDPEKVRIMAEYPRPKTARDIRQFLGLAGHYRRLIGRFSEMAAPLTDLLKGDGRSLVWSDEAENAFLTLKRALTSDPVVKNPRLDQEFHIQCDASDVAAAGVLGQFHDGQEVVIAYWSHKWVGHERSWAATEKEAACVLMAIRHYRAYIAGDHFTVYTDAKALTHLLTIKSEGPSRLARWSLEMAEYDVDIKHRPGKDNLVPDALSRAVMALDDADPGIDDPWLANMIGRIAAEPQRYADLRLEGRRLYKLESLVDDIGGPTFTWKEYVPEVCRKEVVESKHRELCHMGWEKCFEALRRMYFWPGMRRITAEVIRSCQVCLHTKRRAANTRVPMGRPRIADHPFQMICIDHWGPLTRSTKGNTYLLVVVDVLTKYVLLHPARNAKAEPVVSFLEDQVFLAFGSPETIISDNAKAFMGRRMMELLNNYGVDHWSTPIHHPQSNLAERYIQTVGSAVRSMLFEEQSEHRNWDAELVRIQAAMNSLPNEATGVSPFKLNFGRERVFKGTDFAVENRSESRVDLPEAELVSRFRNLQMRTKDQLRIAQEKHRRSYNRNSRPLSFFVGEIVWRRNRVLSDATVAFSAKLAPKFIKARVIETLGNDTYLFKDDRAERSRLNKIHANDMYKDVISTASE